MLLSLVLLAINCGLLKKSIRSKIKNQETQPKKTRKLGNIIEEFDSKYLDIPFCLGTNAENICLIVDKEKLNVKPEDKEVKIPTKFIKQTYSNNLIFNSYTAKKGKDSKEVKYPLRAFQLYMIDDKPANTEQLKLIKLRDIVNGKINKKVDNIISVVRNKGNNPGDKNNKKMKSYKKGSLKLEDLEKYTLVKFKVVRFKYEDIYSRENEKTYYAYRTKLGDKYYYLNYDINKNKITLSISENKLLEETERKGLLSYAKESPELSNPVSELDIKSSSKKSNSKLFNELEKCSNYIFKYDITEVDKTSSSDENIKVYLTTFEGKIINFVGEERTAFEYNPILLDKSDNNNEMFKANHLYLNELINDFSNISGFRGQSGKFTPKDEIYLNMFDRVIYQLDKLPNALSIEKTADNKLNTRINVVGDIRGNYDSLTKILNSIGLPSQNNIILFNGDIVDGGNYQLLCWVTILLYRYFYPKALFINKGNHEDIFVNRDYKFIHYYETNYSSYLRRIRDVYNVLPIALNYDKKLFAVHGGLPIKKTMLEDGITMNTFNKDYKRKLYNSTTKYFKLFPTTEEKYDEDILNMIWSDPFFDISEDKFKFAELRQVKKTIEDEMADYMKPFNGFMKNTIKVDKFINLKKEIDLANFRDKGNKHRKEVDLPVTELKKKYNSYKSEMIKLLKLIEEEKKNIEELNQREWKVYTINELRNIIPTMFDDFNIIKHDYSRGDNIYYYDCDDIKKFLKNMKAKFLVRSHQIMQNGFEVYNECPFIYTVTSTAKFYEDNYASYISFDGVNNLIDFYKVY